MFNIRSLLICVTFLSGLMSTTVSANNCTGQLFGVNAGRGEVGLIFGVNEYSGDGSVHSKAQFSSAAMAYVSDLNRLYYVSAPRASQYELDISNIDINSTELKSLPISALKNKYTKIAYVDMNTKEHVTLSKSKPMYRLAYDKNSQRLYGSYFDKLYSIDPATGDTSLLGQMTGYSNQPEMWRGDLAFKNGQLYLVSNTSIFTVDITNLTVSKLSDHNLTTVTGAVFNGVGALIVSRDKSNDYGSYNKSELYHVTPNSGESCLMSTISAQLNDLAVDNTNGYACPETPLCQLLTEPSVTLTPVTASVNEGGNLSFNIELSHAYNANVTVNVSTTPGSATSSDYTYTDQTVTLTPGSTSYKITIPTVNNSVYQGNKQFTVSVSAATNSTGSDSETATIIEDDPDTATQLQNAAKNGHVNWEGSDGCCDGQRIRGIKGHFPNAPAGTVVNFYISSQKIASKALPSNHFSYAGDSQSTWWMNNGTTAWATLTYNGVTVNVHTGHRSQIHNHHNVNCANGCW